MTWIRLECDFPDHELIGALAEGLRVDPDRAAMCLIRVWCRFGEFRVDGLAKAITDTTLEDWARWRGRRGTFAKVFREVCCDEGKIKGWWRQEKLLHREAEKRKRPNQQTRARQKSGNDPAPDKCQKSAGNVYGNGTTTATAVVLSHSRPSQPQAPRRKGSKEPEQLADAGHAIVERLRLVNQENRAAEDASLDQRIVGRPP